MQNSILRFFSKKKFPRFLELNWFLVLILISTASMNAQSTVSGTITDDSGIAMPGVNVVVKNTNTGTTTDFDGNYSINVPDQNATLVFSFIGFVTQEVAVGNKSTINLSMSPSTSALDEVVVIGYGTQSRAQVTGAISTVSSEDITSVPVATADQALQGRAPGVSVVNSGSPGTAPVIRIRGLGTPNNNEPLYVIDGVISSGLGALNANDIENIQVLKDASTTAVYGSQGSNGVIIVTTKKGKGLEKPTLNFDTYTGFQYNDQRYSVLNREEYMQYASEIGDTPERISDPQWADFINHNTNWQDEIFQTGFMQNYNLSMAGSTEKSNFRVSGEYLSQEGAVIETAYKRTGFRANSNFDFGKLKIGETMNVAFINQNPERASGGRSLIEHAIKAVPYMAIYNPDNPGGYQGPNSALDGQDAENPVRVQSLGSVENRNVSVNGSVYGEYELIDGLKFKTQVGLDYYNYKNTTFIPSYNDDSQGGTHKIDYAQITKNTGIYKSLTFTNSLNYNKTIGEYHNVDLLLLAEDQRVDSEFVNASSQNPITNEVQQLSLTGAALSSGNSEYKRLGYLGRINYDYDKRYLISASLRRDASSRFGANNRWGWFPSVSAGWNIAKENFMENGPFNNLKLRGSWGKVGNDRIGDYRYSATLITDFIYPIAGAGVDGTTATGLANPNLKWEETAMTNIGLDFGLFDNKFTGSFEYYRNKSDDLLINRPLPVSLGFHDPNVTENVGSVETKGFEINLGYNDYDGDFTWSANLNLGTSKNEVLSLGQVEVIEGGNFESENLSRISVGEPLFYFFGYKMDGIYQNQAEVDAVLTADPDQDIVHPGDVRFKDINGDGQINADDRVKIGNPYPDLTFGLNLDAQYKNWDFNAFINGSLGNDLYNTNIYDLQGMPRLFNSGTAVLNRWTGEGTSNSIPRALGAPQNVAASDRFVEDGSFTRLKNLTIGYTFTQAWFKEHLSKFRMYVSGQNLITITDYSGLDPEIGNSTVITTSAFEYGIDRGNYPQPKSFILGFQVTF